MNDKLEKMLKQYPKFESLCVETESLRDEVDKLIASGDHGDIVPRMIDIDTNMIKLINYHMQLSTLCLKRLKAN